MKKVLYAAVAAVVWVGASISIAEDKPTAPAGMGEMSPQQQKMMEAMQRSMTPAQQHEQLKQMVGSWKADVRYRMAPDQPEIASSGKLTTEIVMNGKYLRGQYQGEMMGQPFQGVQLLGFDTLNGKYQSLWYDDMTTAMMFAEGTASEDGKVITTTCEIMCAVTNGPRKFTTVTRLDGPDQFSVEMFDSTMGEQPMMTIVYTRMK